MIKKFLFGLLGAVAVLVVVVLVITLQFSSIQQNETAVPAPEVSEQALANFTGAIRIKTVSYADAAKIDSTQFTAFHSYLEKTYPLIHAQLKRETVNRLSLLYTWEGKNPQLKPVILMAHQDVVPIEEGTEKIWTVDPFAGTVKDNFV